MRNTPSKDLSDKKNPGTCKRISFFPFPYHTISLTKHKIQDSKYEIDSLKLCRGWQSIKAYNFSTFTWPYFLTALKFKFIHQA